MLETVGYFLGRIVSGSSFSEQHDTENEILCVSANIVGNPLGNNGPGTIKGNESSWMDRDSNC
jgi:hypothetical protein